MRQFKDDKLPRKNLLSMQIDLNKFAPATDAEKAQHETMRESTTFFRDGMRKLMKNPLAVLSLILLAIILITIIAAPMIVPYKYEEIMSINGDLRPRNKAHIQKMLPHALRLSTPRPNCF